MPQNMKYCMFENTYKALQECNIEMRFGDAPENLSKEEKYYFDKLIKLCENIVELNGYLDEINNVNFGDERN